MENEMTAGVPLVVRKPSGWQTQDGKYLVVEWKRGEWHAYELQGGKKGGLVAVAATRVRVAKELQKLLETSAPIPPKTET